MKALFSAVLAAAALAAALPVRAQTTFITMGRLFTTPVERTQLDQQRNSSGSAVLPEGAATQMAAAAAPPAMPAAPAEAAPPAPEVLQLNGVLRRSNGKTIVWINNEPQDSSPSVRGQSIPLDLAGRKVILKPGQSYDPATGAIQESGR
ncbi:hypothetical protein [Pseudoduganella rhizocola]|uniref:hypothetical protein n=1 Tax=Pseudoduganella rhizocola TaxID=3382643 RepID=UPI0038B53BA8